MRQGLIALSLTVSLAASAATHDIKTLLIEYERAVTHDDIPTFVRLADPNMRALIERGSLRRDDTINFIDMITGQPVRVVHSPKGVVFLGWIRQHCARC